MTPGLWIGVAWLAGFLLTAALCAFDGERHQRKNWEKTLIEGALALAVIWPLLLAVYFGGLIGSCFRKSGTTTQPPSPASTNQRPGE